MALQSQLPEFANHLYRLRKGRGGAKGFSHWLMQQEAAIVVDGVVPAMGCPVYSLHDGVLVAAADADLAKAVMQQEFEMKLGFSPLIRVKDSFSQNLAASEALA